MEAKKYSDTTALSDRELLGEIDQALARDDDLEAWILVATRSVPEQLVQDLVQKGERIGVPVLVIDWTDTDLAPLAALCAFDPGIVEQEFSTDAGEAARALQPAAANAIEGLRRNLQVWCLGYETLRTQSHAKLDRIWNSRRSSKAELRQDVAGGEQSKKITRKAVESALDQWWAGPAEHDCPAAVVGWEGAGKTWAVLDWLVHRKTDQPIVLVIPSSAVPPGGGTSETTLKRFLAERLYDLTAVRNPEHWLQRLDRLLKRPPEEGPVLTVFLDGMNEEPSIPWPSVLSILQGPAFEGRVRVIVSTRTHHFEQRLARLRSLVVRTVPIAVDLYDASPGGELDQMLALEGLTNTYLADLNRQYAGHGNHLAMVGDLLQSMINLPPTQVSPGSDRQSDPRM